MSMYVLGFSDNSVRCRIHGKFFKVSENLVTVRTSVTNMSGLTTVLHRMFSLGYYHHGHVRIRVDLNN